MSKRPSSGQGSAGGASSPSAPEDSEPEDGNGGGVPRVVSLTEQQLELLARQIARSATAAALGTKGGMSSPQPPPNRTYAQEIPLPSAFSGPPLVDVDMKTELANAAVARDLLKTMAGIRGLQDRLTPGADPRDLQIRALEQEIANTKLEQRLQEREERLMGRVAEALAHVTENGGRKENGKSLEGELLAKVLGTLVDRALTPPANPFDVAGQALENVAKYSSMLKPDLEVARLNASLGMWSAKREDERALAQAQLAAQATEQEKFREVLATGINVARDAFAPIGAAVGEGIRARVAGALPPTPGQPAPAQSPRQARPPSTWTDDELEQSTAAMERAERIFTEVRAEQVRRRARATSATPPPSATPQEEPYYGETVEKEPS